MSVRDHAGARIVALKDRLQAVVRCHALAYEHGPSQQIRERPDELRPVWLLRGNSAPHGRGRIGRDHTESSVVRDGSEHGVLMDQCLLILARKETPRRSAASVKGTRSSSL